MSAIKRHIEDYADKNGITFDMAMNDPNCLPNRVVKPAITLHFSHSGDSSVGISGDDATLTFGVSQFDDEDAVGYIEAISEAVSQALREVWEFKVVVRQI